MSRLEPRENNKKPPESIYERIRSKVEGTGGFESVADYITFVLEEVLKEDKPAHMYL